MSKHGGLRQVQMSQPLIDAPLDTVTFKTINTQLRC